MTTETRGSGGVDDPLPSERALAAISERRAVLLQPSPKLVRGLRWVGICAGLLVAVHSLALLAVAASAPTSGGEPTGLSERFLAFPHMSPVVAIASAMLGLAVVLSNLGRTASRDALSISLLFPVIAGSAAVIMMRLGSGEVNLGEWIGLEASANYPADARGVPLTALALLLLSGGLLLVLLGLVGFGQFLLFFTAVMGLCALIGHLYGIPEFYSWGGERPMVLDSSLMAFVLGIGGGTTEAGRGLAALITGNSQGGRVARKLFWLVVLVPIIAGGIGVYWLNEGIFSGRLVVGLYTVTAIFATGLVTWWISHTLRESDVDRVSALAEVEEVTKLLHERDRLANRLTLANSDLEAFAAIAAHDLRSPLVAIRGYAELLHEDETLVSPAGRRWVERIIAGTDRGSDLIQDLLTYSRATSADVRFAPVDLTELARLAARESIRPDAVTVAALGQVSGERLMLHQLFSNLIENGLKYVPTSRAPRISIDAVRPDDGLGVVIRVSDNGDGIAAADRERLVRMFERGRHNVDGSGIGLAICQRVAERHGGRLWIEESDEGGARICVLLGRRLS